MPRVDSLSEEIIDRIAQEVQELLPEIVSDFGSLQLGSVEAELEETLSVWMLGGDSVLEDTPLADLAARVPYWHHQVTLNDEPRMFARSAVLGPRPEDVSVEEVSESYLASRIADGLSWVEKNVEENVLVRLLVIPTNFVHALWLEEDGVSQVLVVDRPDTAEELRMLHLYREQDFIAVLRRLPHIDGIVRESSLP